MVRTRVGYAGGTKDQPTYHDLGDHTEAIQIDFDPDVISYEELLALFWTSHNPTRRAFSTQYASWVMPHGEEQARLLRISREAVEEKLGRKVATGLRADGTFWRAEGYHQKYRLRHAGRLHDALVQHFGDDRAFVDSTAAARINGLLDGYGTRQAVQELDLPEPIVELLP